MFHVQVNYPCVIIKAKSGVTFHNTCGMDGKGGDVQLEIEGVALSFNDAKDFQNELDNIYSYISTVDGISSVTAKRTDDLLARHELFIDGMLWQKVECDWQRLLDDRKAYIHLEVELPLYTNAEAKKLLDEQSKRALDLSLMVPIPVTKRIGGVLTWKLLN